MNKEKIIFTLLILSFLASCGPRRYGCGPRRCEIKKIELPTSKISDSNNVELS